VYCSIIGTKCCNACTNWYLIERCKPESADLVRCISARASPWLRGGNTSYELASSSLRVLSENTCAPHGIYNVSQHLAALMNGIHEAAGCAASVRLLSKMDIAECDFLCTNYRQASLENLCSGSASAGLHCWRAAQVETS